MNNNQKPRLRLTRRPKSFKESSFFPLMPEADRAFALYTDILIATVPLFLFSIYHYGLRPIALALISAVMMLGFDAALKTVLKKEVRFDLYPAVIGVIIALFLPASAPLWLPIMTAVFATAIGCIPKEKIGISFSPAVFSLIFAFLLFPGIMNIIPERGQMLSPFAFSLESFKVAEAPLNTVFSGSLPDTTSFETFFGLNSARIGEISGFLLAFCFIYLLIRKSAKIILPLTYILTIGIFAYLSPSLEAASDFIAFDGALYNIFGSNTFLCAVFLLSRPQKAARTPLGNAILGLVCGLVTMLLREHVSIGLTALLAAALIDLALPIVNKILSPIPFGGSITSDKGTNSN